MNDTSADNQTRSALDGICVIDLTTGIAGALATMFLCDNGARVVRLIGNDESTLRPEPGFALWDRGKETVVLDMNDVDSVRKISLAADIIIEDIPPGFEKEVIFREAAKVNPRLIRCTISAYGNAGPLMDEPADHDLVMARTGILASQPSLRGGPIHVMHPAASVGAGLLAALGATAALLHRERTGAAQRVETSLMAGALLYAPKAIGDNLQPRAMRMSPAGGGPFYSVFECADGEWIQLGCIHSGFVDLAASVMGIAHLMTDPEFGDGRYPASEEARAKLFNIVADAMRTKPSSEWMRIFEEADVPYAPAQTTEQAMDDPQIRHNEMVIELDDPLLGKTSLPGLPITFSQTPGRVRGPRTSTAIEATEWLAENPSQSDAQSMDAGDNASELPLHNIQVLETANVIAGPIAGRLLADLGADVVKLESLYGDISRPAGWAGFVFYNANKRSISVDTRTEQGRDVAQRIAAQSDVLLANMRPGATERMGLSSEKLNDLNPDLIETHVTAYGWTGPYAHRPGVDPLAQAITGLQRAQGGEGMPPMFLGRLAPCDYTGGAMTALGAVLALIARARTGIAQKVNTNLLNGGIIMNVDGFMRAEGKPPRVLTDSQHFGLRAQRRLYQTSDGWIYIAADGEEQMVSLFQAIDATALFADSRFGTEEARASNDAALAGCLAEIFSGMRTQDAHQKLQQSDVPSAPVVEDYETAFYTDPQAVENGHVSQIEHPTIGTLKLAVNLVTFNRAKREARRATPLLGQQTEEILSEIGYSPDDIQSMYQSEVVKTETPA
ncbi:MAG: CoA transferase [SAR202 cluster bacterium]|nr:CoA transferase [SAR202 cluster bacterium]